MKSRTKKFLTSFKRLVIVGVVLWVMGLLPSFGLAAFAENFKITTTTLNTLQAEGIPDVLLKALKTLHNQLYSSKADFVASLNKLEVSVPIQQHVDLIVKHSRLDNLLIKSEEFSGDLKAGEAIFTGNVEGAIPKDEIEFWAEKIKITTEGNQRYNKIVAETNVHIRQLDRDLWASYILYNRTEQTMQLKGKVKINNSQATIYGATAFLDQKKEWAEVRGDSRNQRNGRARIEIDLKDETEISEGATEIVERAGTARNLATGSNSAEAENAEAFATSSQRTEIQSERALFDEAKREATFEGNVEMVRPQRQIYMTAEKSVLAFNENRELLSAYAEQKVCIEQPGRVARADKAFFDEPQQIIRLEGNAEVSGDGKYLSGNTINLFMDVNKGEAKGDSKTPIQMIISLDEEASENAPPTPPPFTCR